MPGVESRYAEALVDIASEHDLLDDYGKELGQICGIYLNDPGFRDFLLNPVIQADIKKDLVTKVFGGKINSGLLNFLYLLIDNKRMYLLRAVFTEFRRLADKIENTLQIEISSASPLDNAQIDRIKSIYEKEYGASGVRTVLKTDPALIGGVKVKIGDKVIDGTIKSRLEQLAASVLEV